MPALQAAEAALAELNATPSESRSANEASERLARADQVLRLSDAALASVRATQTTPAESEITSLVQEARAQGFDGDRQTRGFVLAFAGEIPRRPSALRAWAAPLANVLRTRRGPILIEASDLPSSRDLADTLIGVLSELGVEASRLRRSQRAPDEPAHATFINVVLLAYGAPPGT